MDVLIVMRMQGEVAEERSCEFRVLVFSPSQERSGHLTISPKTIDFCGPSAFAGTLTATGPPKILAIHGQ
jgi:hypothetical protein